MIVAIQPNIDVSRVGHAKGQILLASDFGDFDCHLCTGSWRCEEHDKKGCTDSIHDPALQEIPSSVQGWHCARICADIDGPEIPHCSSPNLPPAPDLAPTAQ